MKYLVALFLIAASTLLSCNKDNDREVICINGIVRYEGNPAADGLGWVIYKDDSVSNSFYVPQNLSDNFKENNLKVVACLQQTKDRIACRCSEPPYEYRITTIQRR